MSIENKNYQLTERGENLKKIAVKYVGVPAVLLTVAMGATHTSPAEAFDGARAGIEHVTGSDLEIAGTTELQVNDGDTLWDLASNIDSDNTGKIVDWLKNNPANENAINENGLVVGAILTIPIIETAQ